MKTKTCTECNKETPIYKNYIDDQGIRHRACKSCYMYSYSKPIKKVSAKQTTINKEYSLLRAKHLVSNPICQVSLPGCTTHATDIHHTEGRGINTNNANSFLSSCRTCHTKIHTQLSRDERNTLGL